MSGVWKSHQHCNRWKGRSIVCRKEKKRASARAMTRSLRVSLDVLWEMKEEREKEKKTEEKKQKAKEKRKRKKQAKQSVLMDVCNYPTSASFFPSRIELVMDRSKRTAQTEKLSMKCVRSSTTLTAMLDQMRE